MHYGTFMWIYSHLPGIHPQSKFEQGPPAIGWHHLKNELYGKPINRQKTI